MVYNFTLTVQHSNKVTNSPFPCPQHTGAKDNRRSAGKDFRDSTGQTVRRGPCPFSQAHIRPAALPAALCLMLVQMGQESGGH